MKTQGIRYLEQGGLEIIEVDVPEPGPGEVQVKASACGICMWDISTFKKGSSCFLAAPPGHEGIGYINKLGKGVTGLKEGDRVANGTFAGYSNVRVEDIHLVPPSSLPDEHWIVEPVACIVTGLDTSRLLAGDRAAIIGSGFMGLMLIQALAHSPLDEVIAIDIDDEKLKRARQFGATQTANPTAPDFDDFVKEWHDKGVDVTFDCSGSKQGLDTATHLTKTGGVISLFGWIRGEGVFQGDLWHLGGFTVVNSSPLAKIRDTFPAAMRLIHKGIVDLKPLVTDVVPLSGYGPLLDEVIKGRKKPYIKGVVKLSE